MQRVIIRYAWLVFPFLIPIFSISPAVVQSPHDLLTLDTTSFKLLRDQQGFNLQYAQDKPLRVPLAWLVPPDEMKEDAQTYVSGFNYAEQATAFHIGDGRIGLHLSSYKIQREGSAQTAAGRDVFLVFDPKTRALHQGGLALGITKERVRFMGSFFATFLSFIVGDINNDRLIDVGVTREEIKWEPAYDKEKEIDFLTGPFYEKQPLRWYVFVGDHWDYKADYNGRFPFQGYLELPLIGLAKSPVDFVKEFYPGKLKKRSSRHKMGSIGGKRTIIFQYSDFGPQVLAHELIGFEWYQWERDGHPDPNYVYDIKVVVYKDIRLEEVKKIYPVIKAKQQDYRYVEYKEALEYLDKHIRQFEELRKTDPESFVVSGANELLLEFRNTRRIIATH
jgi:hypothetical protein